MSASSSPVAAVNAALKISKDNHSAVCDDLDQRLIRLIESIEQHPNMDHDNPAETQPKTLYFVWDFAHHAHYLLSQIEHAELDARKPEAVKAFKEVLGRCNMLRHMIIDRSGEMLKSITGIQQRVDFGSETRAKSEAIGFNEKE